jgi:serine/threonine protein kinase
MLLGRRPFDAPNQYLLIKAVLEQEPVYPLQLDPDARDLIQKFLVKDPTKRLAADASMSHPFFNEIRSWDPQTLNETDVKPLWCRDAVWMKDSEVTRCMKCSKGFGLLTRKHHCRNCGKIYCHECSSRSSIIPESSYTTQERVCDGCWERLHQQ